MSPNQQITWATRPNGRPQDSDFKLVETPVPEPGDGEFTVQVEYLSANVGKRLVELR